MNPVDKKFHWQLFWVLLAISIGFVVGILLFVSPFAYNLYFGLLGIWYLAVNLSAVIIPLIILRKKGDDDEYYVER